MNPLKPKISAVAAIIVALACLPLSGCTEHAESHEPQSKSHDSHESHADSQDKAHSEAHAESEHHGDHQIIVTSAVRKDVVSTQAYVCQIHSCKHIEVRALERGYLKDVHVNEGQAVKKGELMFKIVPVLYQAKLDSEIAEAQRLEIEVTNARDLLKKSVVSPSQVKLKEAELAKAKANVALAQAELNFTEITAPFDGIVDRQRNQLGSLIDEGDMLTTFSDNSLMWVYFNVPEARYLEYKAELGKQNSPSRGDKHLERDKHRKRDDDDDDDDHDDDDDDDDDHDDDDSDDIRATDTEQLQIELKLANGKIFPQPGKIGAIEADFNNVTGNIPFRADFANPDRLLRNGQTGTILIHRTLKDVVVIPQRATYEILDKRYAYVLDKDNVVHQRDLTIGSVQDDIFVIEKGLEKGDKIILEGIRQVRDGDKIEFEYRAPEKVLAELKYHAE